MRFTGQATGAVPINGSIILLRRCPLGIVADGVLDVVTDDRRDDVGLLALLLPQPPRAHERHLDPAGGIRAGDGARPDPGDDRRLAAVGQLRPRIEMSDAAQRLLAHPLAVTAHVLGQAVGAGPGPRAVVGAGEYGRATGETRRDLDEGLVDEDGDRIEVRGVRLESEPLGLQGDRSAPGEGVEDGGRVVPRRAPDLLADLAEKMLVTDIVPIHHPRDEGEEAPPLDLHSRPGRRLRVILAGGAGRLQELPVALRGVVDQLGEENRTRRSQGPTRPPQVQSGRVALAD